MKKLFQIAALMGLAASVSFAAEKSWMDGVSAKGSIGFESEYVFRGHRIAKDTLVTSLQGAYKLYNGSLYAGVVNHTGLASGPTIAESDLYIGYKLPVYGNFSADFGYTYYWFTNNPASDFRNEIYAGVVYNGLYVNPAAYIYYDFDLEAITGELSGKYSWDLAKYGLANTALDVGAYVGGVTATDANSSQVAGDPHNGYMYYGATADVVYSINKSAAASLGVRYNGNLDSVSNDENHLWWGAKISAGF